MEAQDFFEQTKHQMLEMRNVFYAYNLGEELSADQIEFLMEEASRIQNMLRADYYLKHKKAEIDGVVASALSKLEA